MSHKKPHFSSLKSRTELLQIATIISVSIILRFFSLTEIPYRVDGDASKFALEGLRYIGQHTPLIGVGWMGHANLYFYFVGWFLQLFPNDLLGLRVLSAIGGVLGVFATYIFVKKLFNEAVGFWAGLFLAVVPFHVIFSRVGTEVVWMTFFAPITLYLLLARRLYVVFLSGLLAGIAQYFYPGARIIPILLCTFLVVLVLHKKLSIKQSLIRLLLVAAGFTLSYSPMLIYYVHNPADYFIRINLTSIFATGWLNYVMEKGELWQALYKQIYNCFLVFFIPVEGKMFWFYRTPYLDVLPAVLFAVGLLVGIFSVRKWQFQFLFSYLLLVIIIGGILTILSPMPSRYIVVFPAIAGFVGYGTHSLIEKITSIILRRVIITVIALALIGLSTYSYLMHEQYDTWLNEINIHEQTATYSGRYLSQRQESYIIYFLGTKYFTPGASLKFLTKKDIFEIAPEDVKVTRFFQPSVLIIIPQRQNDLLWLLQQYPHAKLTIFTNPLGKLLCYMLEV